MNIMIKQISFMRSIGSLFFSRSRHLVIYVLACSTIILSLCSCNYQADIEALQVIAAYEIPFVDVDSRWSSAELVEKDNYGRMLYSVHSINDESNNVFSDYVIDELSNSPVLAYVVCQKIDDNYVYYYKTYCYKFVSSLSANNSVIKELKEKNDWNMPIDENKLIKRSTNLDGIENYRLYRTEKQAITDLEKSIGSQIDNYYIDMIFSADEQPIYVVRAVKSWSKEDTAIQFGESYAFRYIDNISEVSYVMLTHRIDTWNEQISFMTD